MRLERLVRNILRFLNDVQGPIPVTRANLYDAVDKRAKQVEETASPKKGYYDPVRNGTL